MVEGEEGREEEKREEEEGGIARGLGRLRGGGEEAGMAADGKKQRREKEKVGRWHEGLKE